VPSVTIDRPLIAESLLEADRVPSPPQITLQSQAANYCAVVFDANQGNTQKLDDLKLLLGNLGMVAQSPKP